MTELPDDELDKLFRKSSEELDPQFDPEDWAKMKKTLDRHDGKTPAAWLKKWWPLGMLALLLPIGIFVYKFTHRDQVNVAVKAGTKNAAAFDKSEEKVEIGKAQGAVESEEIADAKSEEETKAINEESEPGAEVKKVDKKAIVNEQVIAKSEVQKLSKAEKVSPRSLANTGGVYLAPRPKKAKGGDGAFSSKTKQEPEEYLTHATEENIPANRENAESAAAGLQVNALNARNVHWKNGLDMPEIPEVTVPPVVEKEVVKEKAAPTEFARWAVRFGYSPDLSTVGLKDFSKPGSAVSLLAEYAILKRLYIQSGAIWSKKEYYGNGDSYQLPTMPHYYPPPVIGVEGMCNVLEVPVNLRFDLLERRRSTVFIGAGVSSYHMNKEKYEFTFENNYDPKIKYRSWEGKTGWYWLSHLNASVGYEYKLSNKLSLLAEPYLRAPLKRVGYGKVNLFTTGMWISVRFKPTFK